MKIGKILRGLWEHGLDFGIWVLDEWNDEQHTKPPPPREIEVNAFVDGVAIPRPARVPDVRCTHGVALDARCHRCTGDA